MNSASTDPPGPTNRNPGIPRLIARNLSPTPTACKTRATSPSTCTARGNPYGPACRSTTWTSTPPRPNNPATTNPTGPAPTTTTSVTPPPYHPPRLPTTPRLSAPRIPLPLAAIKIIFSTRNKLASAQEAPPQPRQYRRALWCSGARHRRTGSSVRG
ncbi:hypothetical protein GCM10010483_68870 [Actinokineospora diospyrosa]